MKLLKNEDLRRYQAPPRHFQGCWRTLAMISALALGFLASCGSERASKPAPQLPSDGVFALGFHDLPAGTTEDAPPATNATIDPLAVQTIWCDSARCAHPEGFARTNATGPGGLRLTAIVEYLNLDRFQQQARTATSGSRRVKLWGVDAEVVTTAPSKAETQAQRSIVWEIGQRRFRLIATAPRKSALPKESALESMAAALRPEPLQQHIPIRLAHATLTVGAQQQDYDLMYSNEDACLFVQDSVQTSARASGRCEIDMTQPGYSTAPLPVRGGGFGTLVYGWAGPNDSPTVIVGDAAGTPVAMEPKYVRADGRTFFLAAIPAAQPLYGAQNSSGTLRREWNGPNVNDFPWITKGAEAQSPVNLPYTALQDLGGFQVYGLNSSATYEGATQNLFCIVAAQNAELIGTVQVGVLPLCTPESKAAAAITPDGKTLFAVVGATKDTAALLPMLISPTATQIKFPKSPQVILMQPLVAGACIHAELFDTFVDNGHSDRRCTPSAERE